jgi:aspartate oxidase
MGFLSKISAASSVPENLSDRMTKALDVMKKDKKLNDIMLSLTHLSSDWARSMNDKEARNLERKETALVQQAEAREKELGIKSFNGFPYI